MKSKPKIARPRRGDPIFGRLRRCFSRTMRPRIARKRHLCRQLIEGNEVDARGKELYEPRAADQFELVFPEFLGRIVRKQDRRRR